MTNYELVQMLPFKVSIEIEHDLTVSEIFPVFFRLTPDWFEENPLNPVCRKRAITILLTFARSRDVTQFCRVIAIFCMKKIN